MKTLAERIVDRIATEGQFMVIDVAHVDHILDLADAILNELEDEHADLGVHAAVPAAIEIEPIEVDELPPPAAPE